MALTIAHRITQMNAADDELARPFQANCIRWVGALAAGDRLTLSESASVNGGLITNLVWDSPAADANNVEESLRNWKFDYGLRIVLIESGVLWVYEDDQGRS